MNNSSHTIPELKRKSLSHIDWESSYFDTANDAHRNQLLKQHQIPTGTSMVDIFQHPIDLNSPLTSTFSLPSSTALSTQRKDNINFNTAQLASTIAPSIAQHISKRSKQFEYCDNMIHPPQSMISDPTQENEQNHTEIFSTTTTASPQAFPSISNFASHHTLISPYRTCHQKTSEGQSKMTNYPQETQAFSRVNSSNVEQAINLLLPSTEQLSITNNTDYTTPDLFVHNVNSISNLGSVAPLSKPYQPTDYVQLSQPIALQSLHYPSQKPKSDSPSSQIALNTSLPINKNTSTQPIPFVTPPIHHSIMTTASIDTPPLLHATKPLSNNKTQDVADSLPLPQIAEVEGSNFMSDSHTSTSTHQFGDEKYHNHHPRHFLEPPQDIFISDSICSKCIPDIAILPPLLNEQISRTGADIRVSNNPAASTSTSLSPSQPIHYDHQNSSSSSSSASNKMQHSSPFTHQSNPSFSSSFLSPTGAAYSIAFKAPSIFTPQSYQTNSHLHPKSHKMDFVGSSLVSPHHASTYSLHHQPSYQPSYQPSNATNQLKSGAPLQKQHTMTTTSKSIQNQSQSSHKTSSNNSFRFTSAPPNTPIYPQFQKINPILNQSHQSHQCNQSHESNQLGNLHAPSFMYSFDPISFLFLQTSPKIYSFTSMASVNNSRPIEKSPTNCINTSNFEIDDNLPSSFFTTQPHLNIISPYTILSPTTTSPPPSMIFNHSTSAPSATNCSHHRLQNHQNDPHNEYSINATNNSNMMNNTTNALDNTDPGNFDVIVLNANILTTTTTTTTKTAPLDPKSPSTQKNQQDQSHQLDEDDYNNDNNHHRQQPHYHSHHLFLFENTSSSSATQVLESQPQHQYQTRLRHGGTANSKIYSNQSRQTQNALALDDLTDFSFLLKSDVYQRLVDLGELSANTTPRALEYEEDDEDDHEIDLVETGDSDSEMTNLTTLNTTTKNTKKTTTKLKTGYSFRERKQPHSHSHSHSHAHSHSHSHSHSRHNPSKEQRTNGEKRLYTRQKIKLSQDDLDLTRFDQIFRDSGSDRISRLVLGKLSISVNGAIALAMGKFNCPECNRKFSSKSGLELHVLVHTKQQPHVCHYCLQDGVEKRFSQLSNLRRHLKSSHNV